MYFNLHSRATSKLAIKITLVDSRSFGRWGGGEAGREQGDRCARK